MASEKIPPAPHVAADRRRQNHSRNNGRSDPHEPLLAFHPGFHGFAPPARRAARSLSERWPAPLLAGRFMETAAQGHRLAHRGGQPGCCPFRIESRRIGASCWRRDRKRSIHFLRALYDIPRPREPLGEQPRAHHLIFHRKTFRSQKHNLSASATCQVGKHPFYAPHATIRSYVRIKSKRQSDWPPLSGPRRMLV